MAVEMAVRSMETAETAMETDGDGSVGTSPSRPGAETKTSAPKIHQRQRQSCGTLLEILPIPLGFSVPRLYIGEEAASGGDQGGLTMGGRGQGLGRTPCCVGSLWPPSGSLLVFDTLLGKIRILELVSSNSENISCVAF
jgi:hypothetical protein